MRLMSWRLCKEISYLNLDHLFFMHKKKMEYVKEVPTTSYNCYNISWICRKENTKHLDVNLAFVVGKIRLQHVFKFQVNKKSIHVEKPILDPVLTHALSLKLNS